MGAMDKDVSKFGIPMTVKEPLTSSNQAKQIVTELYDAGIPSEALKLQYRYWSNDGLNNSSANEVRLINSMGTSAEFKELASFLKSNNTDFFPEANFAFLYHDIAGDDFDVGSDSSRKMSMQIADFTEISDVTGICLLYTSRCV